MVLNAGKPRKNRINKWSLSMVQNVVGEKRTKRKRRICNFYIRKTTVLKIKTVVFGPDDRIRTCGPMLPKHVLYQTEPHPEMTPPLYCMWIKKATGKI